MKREWQVPPAPFFFGQAQICECNRSGDQGNGDERRDVRRVSPPDALAHAAGRLRGDGALGAAALHGMGLPVRAAGEGCVSTPWYSTEPCNACGRQLGHDGVYVTAEAKWCLPCARRVRDAIDALIEKRGAA